MALRISSQNTKSKFLVKPPEEFEDFPKEEEWEQASRISLMGSQQGLLPKTLDCSSLLTLLLRKLTIASVMAANNNFLLIRSRNEDVRLLYGFLLTESSCGHLSPALSMPKH
uniref:Uncharacterized protein n=1 Tax=Vitis vinifera TaxID=29760 RepID=F6HK11_VITVI